MKPGKLVGIGAAFAVVAFVSGCGGATEGAATAADTAATSAAAAQATSGHEGADNGGRVDIDVEIGDCVQLGGTSDDATISEAACGSDESNYKVIAKAEKNAQCPSDADQVYYETSWGSERGALCLDLDWIMGGCMVLPDDKEVEPTRIECDDPVTPGIERALKTLEGVADIEQCSEGGFLYDERMFTVCTETVRPA